jgi:hypothetical protein
MWEWMILMCTNTTIGGEINVKYTTIQEASRV